ncbi:MAG TPA: hypothetical protein VEA41_17665 [Salinarimonas sp.]|nr:hypothetical protein [Salinarimonas sp.]
MRHELLRFKQHDEGLCGLYTIANALALILPDLVSETAASVLVGRMASDLPTDINTVIREGTDRAQMEVMLPSAQAWTAEQGWPAWTWRGLHPERGDKAQAFWDRLAAEMDGRRDAALVVGFGDDDAPNTRYEPHWTCVRVIGPTMLTLRDSTEYGRVRRAETGIRPEHGWEIEDCFLLERAEALPRRKRRFRMTPLV